MICLIRAPRWTFGVGTELSTSRDDPAMNGVYKLVAIKVPTTTPGNNEERLEERIIYKVKTSSGKRSYPGPKQVYRIFEDGLIKSDLIDLENEDKPVDSLPLLEKIFDKGEILLKMPYTYNSIYHIYMPSYIRRTYYDCP
jgi:nicotinate phosphoribosyltransferase